jgi:hypothetical protein
MSFDFFNQNSAPAGGGGPEIGPNGEESASRAPARREIRRSRFSSIFVFRGA